MFPRSTRFQAERAQESGLCPSRDQSWSFAISEETNLLIGVVVVNAWARLSEEFFFSLLAAAFDARLARLSRASRKF